jgi:hypothetical protein
MKLSQTPAELTDALQRPLFEELANLEQTTLEASLEDGRVRVRNSGGVVARLVRGAVTGRDPDSRFRDGFADLLPGEEAFLRYETAGTGADAVEIRAQNSDVVRLSLRAAAS